MTQTPEHRTQLVRAQEQVIARVTKLEGNMISLVRARRSESDDDEHDPEGVTLSSQWSMLAGVLESAREDAAQAERALERFDAGRYGLCESCGQPIPEGQLEARPFRESCVTCPDATT